MSAAFAFGGIPLDSKVDPFTKVFATLAPFDIHPAGIHDPNGDVAVVTHSLVLLRNGELGLITHDAISVVPGGGEVDQLAECRKLRVGSIVVFAARGQRGRHLHAGYRRRLVGFDGLLFGYLALGLCDPLAGRDRLWRDGVMMVMGLPNCGPLDRGLGRVLGVSASSSGLAVGHEIHRVRKVLAATAHLRPREHLQLEGPREAFVRGHGAELAADLRHEAVPRARRRIRHGRSVLWLLEDYRRIDGLGGAFGGDILDRSRDGLGQGAHARIIVVVHRKGGGVMK
mmetsp:Transcript_2357/g.5794  ORF Transcript_2357/g.5794 Transcript_2357/m.5794 type:complete len:284 (-) Transcript_2357:203-1054(-)